MPQTPWNGVPVSEHDPAPSENTRPTTTAPSPLWQETLQTFSGALPKYKLVAWVQERAHVQVSCMDVLLGEQQRTRWIA